MKYLFNLLFLIGFLSSCTYSEVDDGYSPGLFTLNNNLTLSLDSPSSLNSTETNLIFSIQNSLSNETINLFKDSNCKNKINSFSLENNSTLINLNLENDGTYYFSFTKEKNTFVSKCQDSGIVYTLDRVNPVLSNLNYDNFINIDNQENFTISGLCNKNNQNIVVSVENETNFIATNNQCINDQFELNLDVSQLSDSDYTISLELNSLSGLSTTESFIITKDSIIPSLSYNFMNNIDINNQNTFTFNGSCSDNGQVVSFTVDNVTEQTTCLNNLWEFSQDLSTLNDGLLIFEITHYDASNNQKTVYSTIQKDTTDPIILGLSNIQNIVQSKTWNWSCSETNCFYRYTIDTNPLTTPSSSYGNDQQASISGVNGTYYLHIQAKDLYNNESDVQHYSVTLDSSGPSAPLFELNNPNSNYSTSDSFDFDIKNLTIGDSLYFYEDKDCNSMPVISAINSSFNNYPYSNILEGSLFFSAKIIDNLNRESDCVNFNYTMDITPPTFVNSINLRSPNNNELSKDNTPNIYGTVEQENGSTISIFDDENCNNNIGFSEIVNDSFSVSNISYPIDGTAIGLHHFYYKIIDQAQNESACVDTNLEYTLEATGLAYLPKIAMVGNNSPTAIISLEDNNVIKINNTVLNNNVSQAQVITTNVNKGDLLECSKACYPVTEGFGTAPWASEAYSGKLFTSYIARYGQYKPKIYVASVEDNSFVEILQNNNVIDSAIIMKNDIHEFTVDLQNNQPFLIRSSKNISAYFLSRSSNNSSYTRDARVLTPAANEVIGLTGIVTTTEDNTSVSYTQNTNNSGQDNNLNQTEKFVMNGGGSYQGTIASLVSANKPVSITQTADQNGINATPSVPTSMMANTYGLPRAASYVTFISKEAGTVSVYNPDKSLNTVLNLSRSGTDGPYLVRYALDNNLPSSPTSHPIPAGTMFQSSVLTMAIYDDIGNNADADETLMMGFIQD